VPVIEPATFKALIESNREMNKSWGGGLVELDSMV
jgi:hypothetical protein